MSANNMSTAADLASNFTPNQASYNIPQHDPGAKLDQDKSDLDLVLGSFSRALEEVGKVGTFGAKKYTRNGWLEVSEGVDRYSSAMLRHYLQEKGGEWLDTETNLPHAAAVAWNALARLELMLKDTNKG